jgi:hypothetical protein
VSVCLLWELCYGMLYLFIMSLEYGLITPRVPSSSFQSFKDMKRALRRIRSLGGCFPQVYSFQIYISSCVIASITIKALKHICQPAQESMARCALPSQSSIISPFLTSTAMTRTCQCCFHHDVCARIQGTNHSCTSASISSSLPSARM